MDKIAIKAKKKTLLNPIRTGMERLQTTHYNILWIKTAINIGINSRWMQQTGGSILCLCVFFFCYHFSFCSGINKFINLFHRATNSQIEAHSHFRRVLLGMQSKARLWLTRIYLEFRRMFFVDSFSCSFFQCWKNS